MEQDLPWRVLEVPEDSAGLDQPRPRPPGGPPPDARRAGRARRPRDQRRGRRGGRGIPHPCRAPAQSTLVLDGAAARTDREQTREPDRSAPDTALVAGTGLVIDVTGAVLHPGVYHLPAGSRVADAIAAAGGFGPRVDAPGGAGAQPRGTADGWPPGPGAVARRPGRPRGGIRRCGDAASGGSPGGAAGRPGSTSTRPRRRELDSLPGIGPVTAGKIIASREERPFAAVDDLQTRKLVGSSTFAKLAGLVTVGGR